MSELPRLGADQLRLVHAVRGSVRVEQALKDDVLGDRRRAGPLEARLVGADHQLPQVPADPTLAEEGEDLVDLSMVRSPESLGRDYGAPERACRLELTARCFRLPRGADVEVDRGEVGEQHPVPAGGERLGWRDVSRPRKGISQERDALVPCERLVV